MIRALFILVVAGLGGNKDGDFNFRLKVGSYDTDTDTDLVNRRVRTDAGVIFDNDKR